MTREKAGWEEYSVLIVAAQPTADALLEQCASYGQSALAVGLWYEAAVALQIGHPAVVFTQDVLPDGTWREVFQSAIAVRPEAARIVCGRQSTLQLWMDVLAEGGYDLLPDPCPDELMERIFRRFGQMKAQVCEPV